PFARTIAALSSPSTPSPAGYGQSFPMTRFQSGRELRRRAMTRQRGFTLLEVMVALTITGMVLGSLFTLAAGSKRLAFLSGESLGVATAKRAAVNFTLLHNYYRYLEALLQQPRFHSRAVQE